MQQEMATVVLVVEWFSCRVLCVYVLPDMVKHRLSLSLGGKHPLDFLELSHDCE